MEMIQMKFTGTVTLETDRLILRRLTADDACDMYENWANDEKVTRFLRWTPHKSVEESEKILKTLFLPHYNDEKYLAWGIELKETHSLVGMVDMRINSDDVGEPGYAIGEKYWGKGIVTEALRRIIKHCFEDIRMYRITAVHAVDNPASGRVMEKSGMKCEGIAKKAYRTGEGKIMDCKVYAITDDMYFNRENISFEQLKKAAQSVTGYRTLSSYAAAGSVGAAILTDKNNIYTGVCIDAACSVGFCAEQSAIAAMVTAGEHKIRKLVALNTRGTIYPPCGRCREFMSQLCRENLDAEIMVSENEIVTLHDLLPHNWTESKENGGISPLESERLNLIPLDEGNIPEVFESFTEDVTTYMFPSAPKHISETEAFVNTTLSKMEKGKEIVFAIRLKENDEFIGLGGIHNIPSGSPEIGIWTKKASHGNGYGFEAVSRLISHIRQALPYDHIIYPVDKRNYPSRRIPIMHGGQLVKEYEVVNLSGNTLEIVEYWIK